MSESKPSPLLILGTRLFAFEVADLVSEIPEYALVGFVENLESERCKETLEGLPIYWVDELPRFAATHWAVCAIGTTKRKQFTDQAEAAGMRFATLIHPTARVSKTTRVGAGTLISAGAILGSHITIGRHVIINRGALIGHHTEIGNYVSIQPGANIAGACRIGDSTYIAMGAIVIDHLRIGSQAMIAAGALVTQDVADNVLVAGFPAKVIREQFEGH